MNPSTSGQSPDQEKRTAKALQGLADGTIRIQRTSESTWLAANGDGAQYNVVKTESGWACTCPDWLHHCRDKGLNCKHIEAARLAALPMPSQPSQLTEGEQLTMDEVIQQIVSKLAAPFPASVINWKPQAVSKDKTRALAVAYIDARDVMARLDEVVGPFNWQVKHEQAGDQTVTGLGLKHPLTGEWVWKYDVGFVGGSESKDDDEQMKAVKGTASDGLKRAAVAWGIGRYLYSLPKTWVEFDARSVNSKPPRLCRSGPCPNRNAARNRKPQRPPHPNLAAVRMASPTRKRTRTTVGMESQTLTQAMARTALTPAPTKSPKPAPR